MCVPHLFHIRAVAYESKVCDGSFKIKLLKHSILAWIGQGSADSALRVIDVSKRNRLSRTGLLAGSLDLPVGNSLPRCRAAIFPSSIR
jgi:hypothetical protein